MPSYNDWVGELATLGLLGVEFSYHDYAFRLTQYSRVHISISRLNEYYEPGEFGAKFAEKQLKRDGYMGTIRYLGRSRVPKFDIVLANDLDWYLECYTAFHELAHVAAGHYFLKQDSDLGGTGERNEKPQMRRLATRKPFRNASLREEEAEIRARYAMMTANLGELARHKDTLNQV